MTTKHYLAIDIGASSGRHIVGWREGEELCTREVYRFPNRIERVDGHLVWDMESLAKEVKNGIREALAAYPDLISLAIDTWGVDYVLMRQDTPVFPCYAYRDSRTEDVIGEVHSCVSFETLYQKTGIQFQPFNTVYQLYCDKICGRLEGVTDFLMIPEYLGYVLTGVRKKEFTNATTTGLVNAHSGAFDTDITDALGLPEHLFGALSQPKTSVGMLTPEVAKEVGGQIEVVLCASHDTASAVEGIPMEGNHPYVSSGTWSLLGLKVPTAICDENSRIANYSNEGGIGYTRYQKNIMGMWIVNRLRDDLCPERDFAAIEAEAAESRFTGTVDVNHKDFLAPVSMKQAFDDWFVRTGEVGPQSVGDYFRCAFSGLALGYRTALEELKNNTGASFDSLYIVGGGAKNKLLNRMTEQACGVTVKAIPIEATAIGNMKIQIGRN